MTFPPASVRLEKPPFLRGLRWKITVAFIVLFFALLAVLGPLGAIIEYAFLSASFKQSDNSDSDFLVDSSFMRIENGLAGDYNNLQKDSSELVPWLDSHPRNTDAIRLWLNRYDEKLKLHRKTNYSTYYSFPIDDVERNAAIELNIPDKNSWVRKAPLFQFIVFDDKLDAVAFSDSNPETHEAKQFADTMLKENANPKRKVEYGDIPQLQLAFPILDGENRVKGVLYFKEILPFGWSGVLGNGIASLTDQLVSNLIFFTIVGFVFGSPFAWYLSKRLQNIAFAAQSWRIGDFSAKTNDKSRDEVGILSRHLNEMADDLQENFALRQTIATAEERNRIARDLHDSVKQQVFGLAMQISTASALVEKNPESAKNFLNESENLINEIQAELVDMIHEFSLPVKQNETFKKKIENFVNDWVRQNVIKSEIEIEENLTILPDTAQTFYRITQETLSNIARHSEATEVKITVKSVDNTLQMSIIDNGCGFDTEKIEQGFGLQSIRQRAESLPQGWLKIDSKINIGTTVEIGCDAN